MTKKPKNKYDVNGDGKVDIHDAIAVAKQAMGISQKDAKVDTKLNTEIEPEPKKDNTNQSERKLCIDLGESYKKGAIITEETEFQLLNAGFTKKRLYNIE
jgi:hypothetical protein